MQKLRLGQCRLLGKYEIKKYNIPRTLEKKNEPTINILTINRYKSIPHVYFFECLNKRQ